MKSTTIITTETFAPTGIDTTILTTASTRSVTQTTNIAENTTTTKFVTTTVSIPQRSAVLVINSSTHSNKPYVIDFDGKKVTLESTVLL